MRPLIPQDPVQIGRYRLTHRLGTGGMGQVYLARTPSGIQIVVKVVRAGLLEDAELSEGGTDYRNRFAREAELAARVGGFYTAEVVDSDPHADRPWIAYAYIRGLSLKEFLHQKGTLDPPSLRALAAGLAEGIQAIHGNGLIHRDLKPSNVILALDGPRIIDFGVARPTRGSSMTGTGHVFGTLPYMSPEQAEGTPLSPASDIFALGTTLAHAATGDSPFETTSNPRILLRLVGPPPVGMLAPLPEDLRSLITECWSHDPEQRPTPREIIARCTQASLPRSWPPRHRSPATPPTPPERPPAPDPDRPDGPRRGTLLALAGSVVALMVGITVWLVSPAGGENGAAGPSPEPTSTAGLAEPADPSTAPPGTDPDADPAVARWEAGPPSSTLIASSALNRDLWPLDLSSDGALVAAGVGSEGEDGDGTEVEVLVYLWDAQTGELHSTLGGFDRRVRDLAFSPDGEHLATASWDGTARVWDVASGELVTTLAAHGDRVNTVAFSPDGGRLATGGNDQNLRLWDTSDYTLADTAPHEHGVLSVAFDPSGARIATSDSIDGSTSGAVRAVHLWDAESLDRVATLEVDLPSGAENEASRSVVFSPDGERLAAAGNGGVIHVWETDDLSSPEVIEVRDPHEPGPVRDHIHGLAFSADGTVLASVGGDRNVRLWDVAERTEIHSLPDHSAFVRGVAFGPGDDTMYTTGDDGTVRRWEAP